MNRIGGLRRDSIRMYPHVAEVVPEARLEKVRSSIRNPGYQESWGVFSLASLVD